MSDGKTSLDRKQMLTAMLPQLLVAHGFNDVSTAAQAPMKLVDARAANGKYVRVWVKHGWRYSDYAAAGIGAVAAPLPRTDQQYLDEVNAIVGRAKSRGAQYLLLLHVPEDSLRSSCLALELDDVLTAFSRQLQGWPTLARNGQWPTIYFDTQRDWPPAGCVAVARELGVPLSGIAGLMPPTKGDSPASKTVWAEVERRTKQELFRGRVGERCGWTCAVTGNQVVKVLEAAHLPGKNWRFDNEATDGIMLRVDLHRLLDARLAELRQGRFWIHESARCDQYAEFHDRPYAHP